MYSYKVACCKVGIIKGFEVLPKVCFYAILALLKKMFILPA